MTNDLALRDNDIIHSVDELIKLGTTLIRSGLLPKTVNTPESAAAIILKGRELGIGPMEALSSINVILGKPTTSPQLMLALARRTKELEDLKYDDDGEKCTVTVKRKGQSSIAESFSMSDAKAMGLIEKDNWKKQPRTMRKWRAFAANLRMTFPDAISGLYTYEEMGADVNDEGELVKMPVAENVIEGKATVVQSLPELVAGTSGTEIENNALQVVNALRHNAANYKRNPTPEQLEKMRGLMNHWVDVLALLPKDLTKDNKNFAEELRHTLLKELWGVSSSSEMSGAQVAITLDWLGLTKADDGKYIGTDKTKAAKRDFDVIMQWFTEKAGQRKMEL